MSDIAKELRERSLLAEQEGEPLALLDEAADEIERLRLTDAEREAVGYFGQIEGGQYLDAANRHAVALRGILERLF